MTAVLAGDLNVRSVLVLVGLLIVGGGLMGWALSESMHQPPPDARVLFQKRHPCPANGNTRGECPGYAFNHIKPLCAGGADRPANLQWLTVAEARKKERLDAQGCRIQKKQKRK